MSKAEDVTLPVSGKSPKLKTDDQAAADMKDSSLDEIAESTRDIQRKLKNMEAMDTSIKYENTDSVDTVPFNRNEGNTDSVDTVLFNPNESNATEKTDPAAEKAGMESQEMMEVDGSSSDSTTNERMSASKEKRRKKMKERRASQASKKEPAPKMDWRRNLRTHISNMYMKSENRLPGACVPKCLQNTKECVDKHRVAMLPDVPNFMMAEDLKMTLNGHHYDTFLDMLEMMALQGVYPGDGVLDRLVEMAMILVAKEMSVRELARTYGKIIRTFFLLVDAFPPCWTCLRPYYLNLLGVPNTATRSGRSDIAPQKLKLYLNLLEELLPQCSDKEIRGHTRPYEEHVFNFSEEEDLDMSQETVFLKHVQEYDWASGKLCLDDFKTLSPGARLSRICDVLNMLCWVLEMEFLSWLDHNRLRQSETEMFNEETKPFAIHVFGMSATVRLTDIVRQVMRLFGLAAAKSLYPDRLRILHRLISLVVEVSNTAELKYVDNTVTYPNMGPQTRLLIAEFFKIFKTQNPQHISTYIKSIPLLEQPYLRFEFTDHFLQLFYFPRNVAFGPKKVSDEFNDRQWVKYKPRSEIEDDDDEQLSREDYLNLLLNALKDYDKWMNLEGFWKFMKGKEQVQPLQTRTSSPLATPVGIVTGETFKVFDLGEMEKEVPTWKKRLNTKVIVGRPMVNLPVARINLPELSVRYSNDVRYIRYLRRVLVKEVQPEIDVSDWLDYLNGFLCDDEPQSQPASPRSSPGADSDEAQSGVP
ncbi:uncharacterized protein LOC111067552 [Drosophila obscura]|uniref:uncharacterized protein LOC111067552 n=1 Tax=Drosophila obscura TaxID=7282 RepID=UPI001BB1BFFD|nr:uncharacterized protein LOC111067552 [Drosophila obscura]